MLGACLLVGWYQFCLSYNQAVLRPTVATKIIKQKPVKKNL